MSPEDTGGDAIRIPRCKLTCKKCTGEWEAIGYLPSEFPCPYCGYTHHTDGIKEGP